MDLPGRDVIAGQHERMRDVLARIHSELEEIARRIDHNQAAIAQATWQAGVTDADYVRAMQDADLSAQRIAGVAAFLRAIGEAAHPRWRVDTAAADGTIRIAALARSIGSGRGVATRGDDAAGEVDLF